MLIDTGLNLPLSFQSLCKGLSDAGVKLEELNEILLTHFHVDHVGLISRLKRASKDVGISIHRVEAELSKLMSREFTDYLESMETFLRVNGAPPTIADNLQGFHPAFFTPQAYEDLATSAHALEDGHLISVGDYSFEIVWTPGHSPGHICLYEASSRILVSGDHLLPTITPHVAQFIEDMDPLTDYLESLEKVQKLDVDVVLPAHEESFTNHQERIEQLKKHHEQRLREALDGLKVGSLTAYTLASRIHWDVNYESWDEFPLFQKYLALGETLAHLNLLEQRRLVRRTDVDQVIYYDVSGIANLSG